MNGDQHGVPIIGQQQRVVISDHRIIMPNSVEVVDHGMGMGASIACLRVLDPLKGRAYNVPLLRDGVRQLADQLLAVADNHDADADTGD